MGKKKRNKAERDKMRAFEADVHERGFKMGYNMGFAAGRKKAVELMQRQVNKVYSRGS